MHLRVEVQGTIKKGMSRTDRKGQLFHFNVMQPDDTLLNL